MAEDHLSCSHRLMASALRILMPLGSGGSDAHVCQPCMVGRFPLNWGVGPHPSSQMSHLCGSSFRWSTLCFVPCSRLSSGPGEMVKSSQNSLSLFAAHTGPAGILVGLPAKYYEIMFSGSSSMMTFSMMCLTTIRRPAACLTSSRMRVAS